MLDATSSSPITDLLSRMERCYRIDVLATWNGTPRTVEVRGVVYRRGRGDRAWSRRPVLIGPPFRHSQLAVSSIRARLIEAVTLGRLPLE